MGPDDVVLSTERLVLRRLRAEDAATIAGYRSEPDVARMQGWDAPYSEAAAAGLIARVAGHDIGALGWAQLGIEVQSTGELVGDCGINGHDPLTVELGFTVAKPHWRKGYASEAVGALVDLLVGSLGFAVIVAKADPGNTASIALLESLGFAVVSRTDDDVNYAFTQAARGIGPA